MRTFWLVIVLLSTLSLGGCEAIVDIFQVGLWTGVILVVLLLALIAFIARKLRR